MATITLPDDVTLPALARALRSIGLRPLASDGLRFERIDQLSAARTCAHPACTRDGAIVWADDAVSWCADHAWAAEGAR